MAEFEIPVLTNCQIGTNQKLERTVHNVADPECLARILIISIAKRDNKNKKGGGKICRLTFFVATNFTNLKLFYFWTDFVKKLSQMTKKILYYQL
jgi:hypothetical protein